MVSEPDLGLLEVYRLQSDRYVLEQPDENGRYWFEGLQLLLGTWQGEKENRSGYWLRWWDAEARLLPWAIEKVEVEQYRADVEKQRADRSAEALRKQGIDPDAIA